MPCWPPRTGQSDTPTPGLGPGKRGGAAKKDRQGHGPRRSLYKKRGGGCFSILEVEVLSETIGGGFIFFLDEDVLLLRNARRRTSSSRLLLDPRNAPAHPPVIDFVIVNS